MRDGVSCLRYRDYGWCAANWRSGPAGNALVGALGPPDTQQREHTHGNKAVGRLPFGSSVPGPEWSRSVDRDDRQPGTPPTSCQPRPRMPEVAFSGRPAHPVVRQPPIRDMAANGQRPSNPAGRWGMYPSSYGKQLKNDCHARDRAVELPSSVSHGGCTILEVYGPEATELKTPWPVESGL